MNDKIKEILDYLKDFLESNIKDVNLNQKRVRQLLDCITNLQSKIEAYELFDNQKIANLQEENERLKKISHKMHLWIFLNCGDEQKVYDELGLTDEENAMLGYSGQFRIGSDKE